MAGIIVVAIVFLIIIIGATYLIIQDNENKRAYAAMKEIIQGINGSYEWDQFADGQIILHDIDNRIFYFINHMNQTQCPYGAINDVELVIDDSVAYKSSLTSTAGRALVGGALAGGVGAVIGGVTGKKTGKKMVHRIELIVSFNGDKFNYARFTLLNSSNGEDIFSYRYNERYELGLKWSKKISALSMEG